MKRVWITGAVVLAVVAAASVYVPLNFLRPGVERALGRGLGRRVDIDNVYLTALPAPGCSLDGVTIHEDPRAGIEPFAYVQTLDARVAWLGLLRLLSGATAGAIIPLAMAYLGDVVAYEQRQTVLARFLSGQILGVIFGQVFGGLFGDTIGWRGVFVVLGAIYLVITVLLMLELRSARIVQHRSRDGGALIARNLALLQIPRVRIIIATAFIEAFFFFGGFVYLGAYLRFRFALSYLAVGTLLASFGLGGLAYASAVRFLVATLGERGLALAGGITLAIGFCLAAAAPVPWSVAPVIAAIGAGFYMLHNTLQTNATQMAPEARGLAISLFAFCYFLGQAAGVAACGWWVDAFGYGMVFAIAGIMLLIVAICFRATLAKRPAAS